VADEMKTIISNMLAYMFCNFIICTLTQKSDAARVSTDSHKNGKFPTLHKFTKMPWPWPSPELTGYEMAKILGYCLILMI
jgi:hypothetical protein